MNYKAVIAGASGLIGSSLLNQLLNHPNYSDVTILVRKKLSLQHQKLKQLVIDFDHLENYGHEINGHALFCCLGTTRNKTPDLKTYRTIDHDYPVQLAKIAGKNSIEQYHFISSMGADASSYSFYTKLKGETENDLKKVQLKTLVIYQPSLLTGNRHEKRTAERFAIVLMKIINPLLTGKLEKYKSIEAVTVARAMVNQSLKTNTGIFTYTSDQIKKLA
jgi:uncharacterized protein YbjT (DUF2867 family)